VINKDIACFAGCHLVVTVLKESGNTVEDILDKSYELFKIKHAKGLPFTFIHCWRILRVVPKWQELAMVTISHPPPIARTTPTKWPASATSGSDASDFEQTVLVGEESGTMPPPRYNKKPQGTKAAKEMLKQVHIQDSASRAQAMATLEMAKATRMKAEVAFDNAAFKLFSRPLESVHDASAHAYFMMQRDLEMNRLKWRVEDEMNSSAPTPAVAQVVPPAHVPAVPHQFAPSGMARPAVSLAASAGSVPPLAAFSNEFQQAESTAGVAFQDVRVRIEDEEDEHYVDDFRCPMEEPRQYAMNSIDLAGTLQFGSHGVRFDMNN
jgi:hypothetical protein